MSIPHLAVIGGGVTGLAAALKLRQLSPAAQVTLLEASPRLGGVLGTERRQGFMIERSADMFTIRDPGAIALCRRIGFEEELIEPTSEHQKAYLIHRGRLVETPGGFSLMSPNRIWPVLATPLLSWRGKLRLGCELFVRRRRETGDESLASFARRRLGKEVYERLVQPLIGGIYTADPEKLSMAATMDSFLEMERLHGSLIRGAFERTGEQKRAAKAASGARYQIFRAPREGMQAFVDALAAQLPPDSIRLQSPVERIERTDNQWRLTINGQPATFDGVICCSPAGPTASMLADFDSDLATLLRSIPHASTAIAVLGYRRDQLTRLVEGFGFVAPQIERRKILAGSFSSVKFPGRAPEDTVLIRVFVGGALQPELLEQTDEQLLLMVRKELADLVGAEGEPLLADVVRWQGVMPQYHVGHTDIVHQIETTTAAWPGLELAGNAYRGVGIPACIRDGERAADRLLQQLAEGSKEN
ncbi:protoporphyrinogen oxidase [Lignipirellula cremea]|uniref:Coproporphyrinogen III oxidase n=1 Tax=Lignipirellula cremea TaxID=2528010 RepID=A0A518E040_9BACT|nr:protoporphyrinogen oxidase [Lignipirellula cremea]QDU97456.1 Protoporphyrinogen oxidase [Lignipirellula cremea]